MPDEIQILFVEDSEADALLIARWLNKHGVKCTYEIVDNVKDLLGALGSRPRDIVLSDYNLPQFDAPQALAAVRAFDPDLPVIVVSGSIGEEQAADLMRMGARDIVLKSNLIRLGPAILREIADRMERQRLVRHVIDAERRFSDLVKGSIQGIAIVSRHGLHFANDAYCRMFGYSAEELASIHRNKVLYHADDQARIKQFATARMSGDSSPHHYEARGVRRDGSLFWVEHLSNRVTWNGQPATQIVAVDITDRKEAERKLVERERKYRETFENAPVAMFRNGFDRKIVESNAAMRQLLGYSEEELAGRRPRDFIPEEDKADSLPLVDKLWTGEADRVDMEHRMIRRDGKTIWVRTSVSLTRDDDGQPFLITHCQDTTERREAELALVASENQYRELFDNTPVAMCWVSPEGHYIQANRALQDLLGYSAEEFLTMHPLDTVHPEDQAFSQDSMGSLFRPGGPDFISDEVRHIRKDGRVIWVLIAIRIVRNEDGSVRYILAQLQDITGRREAENALVASENQFRVLFENAPVAMAWISNTGKFFRANRAYQEMLGYSESELATMRPVDVMHPDIAAQRAERMKKMFAGTSELSSIENRLVRKDGKSIWVLVNAKVMTDPRTEERYILAHLQDITARKTAEEQLFHSQKMEALGNLAGGIAHDFNNMLLPIVALTELTKASLPDGDALHENLDTVLEAADKAGKLVKQILTFSRQDQSEKAEIDISRCMKEALGLIKNILPSSITVNGHIGRDVGTVIGDQAQLHSVVLNLASNAADAMAGRVGEFEITLTRLATDAELVALVPGLDIARNYARIVVRDNGSGMDKQTLDKIFNPFFTTKAPGEGTGLGLAMVHGIVERHGGVVTVSSELGVGTRFAIYLPLQDTSALVASPASVPKPLVPAE
jgi:two-component system, cell cycle sensor histidine kinase and response regulator CckA